MKKNLHYYFSPDEDASSVGTGDLETSTADLSEGNVEDGNSESDGASVADNEPAPQNTNVDMNAIYANARRRAEAEADKKINAIFAERFGKLQNPKTGQNIGSYKDYLDALDAQEQMAREQQLKDQGVDASLIAEIVANDPTVRHANEVIQREEERVRKETFEAQVSELMELDSSIKSVTDIPTELFQKANERGISIVDAYKIENFGKWNKEKASAERQAAINQAKGKDHLKPVDGVATDDNLVDIPVALKGLWETMFPDKSPAERKKLYNKQL